MATVAKRASREASMMDIKNAQKANKNKRLGGGAIVSFPLKYVHPHSVRDAAHPDRQPGQRLTKAGVLMQLKKSINGEQVWCVLCHHRDFRDENGVPIDVWVKKEHVTIEKEGNPEMFY